MQNTESRIAVLGDLPSFVFADSTFELEIKDVKKIKDGTGIETEKIQLMEFSDATW